MIIGHGGFLGLGEKRVAVPVDRLDLRGNKLIIPGLTDDQIRAMPAWDRNDNRYRELAASDTIPLTTLQ